MQGKACRRRAEAPEIRPVARAAEALYREGKLTVREVARNPGISKTTLYTYLRHHGVEIGVVRK